MIFRSREPKKPETTTTRVAALLRAHASGLDDETLQLLTAVTGLIACVAYADRKYTEAEQAQVRDELGRMHGLSPAGVDAVCATLRDHVVELGTCNMQAHTRLLREACELDQRREVLQVLVDLAASDGALSMDETNLLRRVTSALGLTQDDYLVAQSRHRDRLSVLK
jgi:uncharacterized tellurite resistance protein B-like protein